MLSTEIARVYHQQYPELPCGHSALFFLGYTNLPEVRFCGLCQIKQIWETEIPSKIHEHKLLAENGNPETSTVFMAHLKANLGLIPPKPGQNLQEYRKIRKRRYGVPNKNTYPVATSLYNIMGVQPKLATPLLMTLCGSEVPAIRKRMMMTSYGVHLSMSKGIRMVLREILHD